MENKVLPEAVDVEYHLTNAVHVFTSTGPAGLVHIDSKDQEEAYNRIAPVLSDHFSAYYGQKVAYSPSITYKEFCQMLDGCTNSNLISALAFTLDTQIAA